MPGMRVQEIQPNLTALKDIIIKSENSLILTKSETVTGAQWNLTGIKIRSWRTNSDSPEEPESRILWKSSIYIT